MSLRKQSNLRILVIDDDAMLLRVYRDILGPRESVPGLERFFSLQNQPKVEKHDFHGKPKRESFEVITADQGAAGVAAAREALKVNRPFAAAFVDMRMPPGIDGLETARLLREEDERLYIVIVTAHSDYTVDAIQETIRHNVLVLRKPFIEEEVFQLARNFCVSWERDAELKRLSESQQYAAFQSGVAEMSTSILHNVGNAVAAVSHHVERIVDESGKLTKIGQSLPRLRDVMMRRVDGGESERELLDELLKKLGELGEWIRLRLEDGLTASARDLEKGIHHVVEIIRIQQEAAHPESGVTNFDPRHLIEDVLAMLHDSLEKRGIEVTVHIDEKSIPKEVAFPRNSLLQVLINLIKNSQEAITEHAPEKGRITIGLSGHTISDLNEKDLNEKELIIEVRDNGIGASQETLDQLFAYGYSTKKRGSGYGLHASANFIQSQGGRIEARTDGRGRGMRMKLSLPMP